MTKVHNIRKMYFEDGKNITERSRETGHDRKTTWLFLCTNCVATDGVAGWST